MIGFISSNDLGNALNILAGKFGWSEKDEKKRFYLQNVVIGTVKDGLDENGKPIKYLEPWRLENESD